ncbi:hypothetical protein AB5J72_22815 [Streptomyces sp. CG1]|uniref:hypothetical protein n=1 Tax=Streptomyces sp. CG1 TaxID=1287523 RepID=UPI0034E26DA1
MAARRAARKDARFLVGGHQVRLAGPGLGQNVAAASMTLTSEDLARIVEIAPDGGLDGSLN